MGCLDGELQRSSMVGVPCGVQNKPFLRFGVSTNTPRGPFTTKKHFMLTMDRESLATVCSMQG